MSFKVTEANIEHAEIIVKIAIDTYWPTYGQILSGEQIDYMLAENYSLEKIQLQLSTGSQNYLLLQNLGGECLAFAAYSPSDKNPMAYQLQKLYCLPETQGKGAGKLLINEVIKITKLNGRSALDLNVNRNNPTVNYYMKMGFQIILQENNPIGPYVLEDYLMRMEW